MTVESHRGSRAGIIAAARRAIAIQRFRAAATILSLLILPCTAQAEPLLQTTTTWEGGAIAYPGGEAEVTAVILRIEEGQEPPFHCHPVPTLGYVLTGVVQVETKDGRTRRIEKGESVVEVMNTVHRGIAIEAPVEIIVFYAGARGIPNTVLPADDPDHRYCSE
jgi:quercetin dioxygenase-like cupin family protein